MITLLQKISLLIIINRVEIKRLLTIQDFSCMGRCSLTVALPTISACGIECVAIPSSILSNHTAYESWTFTDLSEEIIPITSKWDKYKNQFDCIYTGYLSTKQVRIVEQIIKERKEKSFIFVDPAMADKGKLYKGFDNNHILEMKRLISLADLIKANITEACFLTDEKMLDENHVSKYDIFRLLDRLSEGKRDVVISGFELEEKKISIAFVSKGKKGILNYEKLPGEYHGTGDLFSSALIGLYLNGLSLQESIEIAHEYVYRAIKTTIENNDNGLLYGPSFEPHIAYLSASIKQK